MVELKCFKKKFDCCEKSKRFKNSKTWCIILSMISILFVMIVFSLNIKIRLNSKIKIKETNSDKIDVKYFNKTIRFYKNNLNNNCLNDNFYKFLNIYVIKELCS